MNAFETVPEFESTITPDEALIIEVDGFEGPLDLLLALARNQKVDIAKISVLRACRPVSRLHGLGAQQRAWSSRRTIS